MGLDLPTTANPEGDAILGARQTVRVDFFDGPSKRLVGTIEVFDRENHWWTLGDIESDLFKYRSDPTTSPKEIDISDEEGTVHGIYAIRDNMLTTCFADPDGTPRPTEFSAGRPEWSLSVAKRLREIPPRTR